MAPSRPSIADKRRTFAQLHESGCFAIPNPFDVGSALFLQSLRFKAIATTSSGFAWTIGQADNQVSREAVLTHLAAIVDATDIPVNADFESGFGTDAGGVGESVRLAVATGIAGLSIEDSTGIAARPLYAIDEAVARVRAARRAIDQAGGDTLLVGRAECFLVGRPDLAETIARLKAYASAGADCLYAPGLRTQDDIRTVVAAVAPKPLNVLLWSPGDQTMQEFLELGVRRVSVGGALARAAWGGFIRAARLIADQGRFDGLAGAAAGSELNALFQAR
jgi:2-methylisocitrate lyase-like PEP mutase family enzyme